MGLTRVKLHSPTELVYRRPSCVQQSQRFSNVSPISQSPNSSLYLVFSCSTRLQGKLVDEKAHKVKEERKKTATTTNKLP